VGGESGEPFAFAAQQCQLLDPAGHRQMLAFDNARDLLGLGRLLENAQRDMGLERLADGRRIERLIEAGQFGKPSDGSA